MSDVTFTMTHWGAYRVRTTGGRLTAIEPFPGDKSPSPIGQSLLDTRDHPVRITRPMVRSSFLQEGLAADSSRRGTEPFVAVDWPVAIALAANALDQIKSDHGNAAIYGGSYGWASAGRFHHAQSQVHRFLKMFGGYADSRNTYSMGAMEVILPHILTDFEDLFARMPSWDAIAQHTEVVLAFGGLALKNTQVNVGGVARHSALQGMEKCAAAGVRFVNISPIADDVTPLVSPDWVSLRPNSDTAVMLAIAHVLIKENRVDHDFVERCCVGFPKLRDYILGITDGVEKDPVWASALSDVPTETIEHLAREISSKRSLILVSWSVQRGEHGEQPIWMAVALAAMAGSLGKPGGGVGIGQNSVHALGHAGAYLPAGSFPQGENPVKDFIPVARIADMLLNPGQRFDYNGQSLRYPDIHLIYWAGGNPFHHHQDLGRLVRAWRKPKAVIVHEPYWTPLARFADIVLPCATMLERNDIGVGLNDGTLVAMKRAMPAPGLAMSDYEIFSQLADKLGFGDLFTEGLDEAQWLRRIYAATQERCAQRGVTLPDFEEFWTEGTFILPPDPALPPVCAELRENPETKPLPTPSGKVELYSEKIASFGYDDCPGHPAWLEPEEWLGSALAQRFPLHLISNQPSTRLHSQLDFGRTSLKGKIDGREPCELNPSDAKARNIQSGDLVRIHNDRGSCISVATLNDRLKPGIIKLSTGAWYDPSIPGDSKSTCLHGNPNVLTRDKGTSRLAQATTAHSCLVEVERIENVSVPEPRPHAPPSIVDGQDLAARLAGSKTPPVLLR